jgi:hypothetical protein
VNFDDARISLDNNPDRTRTPGRGARSQESLRVALAARPQGAALFYSLIESAKLCGVEPKRYLLTATRAALADRAAVMLPHTLLA